MSKSTQHKLSKIRPPRVQITYDLEVGDAIQTRELPFVVGILADLCAETVPLKDRHFINIDKDNFSDVMTSLKPSIRMAVKNHLGDPDTNLVVDLTFKDLKDFEPFQIVQKVPALARLFETRCRLKDLLTKLDANEILRFLLQDVYQKKESQEALKKDLAHG
jgi:type VI secretion system protein ImpB